MIYRVLKNLAVGSNRNSRIVAGSTVPGSRFGDKMAAILVAKGALSPVSAPPLDILPGWKLRAKKFTEAGYDAIAILETDDDSLAFATGYRPQSIKKWKVELEDFLGLGRIKEVKGCSGCDDKEPLPVPEFLQDPQEEDLLEDELDESEIDMEVTDATNND